MPEFLPVPPAEETHAAYDPARHVNECYVCGRGLTEAAVARGWYVHMTTAGTIAPVDLPEDALPERDDQGWFPVGSECARRIPLTHRQRWS